MDFNVQNTIVDAGNNIYVDFLVRPEDIRSETNQIAGHHGFHHCKKTDRLFKPIDTEDVRGQREYTFYRLVEIAARQDDNPNYNSYLSKGASIENEITKVKFSNFDSVKNGPGLGGDIQVNGWDRNNPAENCECNCYIDMISLKKLSKLVPKFFGIAALIDDYEKSRDKYETTKQHCQQIFICLQDMTAHCQAPCIIDIKVGRKTYDGWASAKKISSETEKYAKSEEFGFRILGMKTTFISEGGNFATKLRDKNFGKNLLTPNDICKALSEYFEPLLQYGPKVRNAIIEKICDRLEEIEHWFLNDNKGQFQFISSSLLVVYDSSYHDDSVRVSMIDIAHVFHNHQAHAKSSNKRELLDNNYLYGLQKLKGFMCDLKNVNC